MTGAAVAATRDWWTDAEPATNKEVVEVQLAPERCRTGWLQQIADPALARTVARAPGAALVAAPTKKGGYCLLPQLPRRPGESVVGAGLGFSCGGGRRVETVAADSEGVPHWYVYGRILDAGAASVDLSDAAGTPLRVGLGRDGFFMASLPESSWGRLDDRWDNVAIADSGGHVIRKKCVCHRSTLRGCRRCHRRAGPTGRLRREAGHHPLLG